MPADLTPLVVASVGFIAGSTPGAVFGFGLGLFVDVPPRSDARREFTGLYRGGLRCRAHPRAARPRGLAPVAVGAVATVIAAIGFALLQFLLGVRRQSSSCWSATP